MNNKLIELLKDALWREYSDVFLYPREAKTIEDKDIAKKFEEFGAMEIRHADIISLKLLDLSEKPTWDFTMLKGGASLREILEDHLKKERDSVLVYDKCIEATDDDNFKIVLRGIRANEEYHAKYVEEALKKLT